MRPALIVSDVLAPLLAPLLALCLLALAACGGAPSGGARPSGEADSGVDGGASPPDSGGPQDSGHPGDSRAPVDSGGGPSDSGVPSDGCAASQVPCPLGCADLQTDVNNCGSCGYGCPAGPAGTTVACVAGACVATCVAPLTDCGYSPMMPICVNLETDADHCGSCDNLCEGASNGGTGVCSKGSCTVKCPGGLSYCAAGGCVDTATDASNCGSGCVDCSAQATADGIPSSSVQSVSCNKGACQATVVGTVTGGATSGGKTCDKLCKASLKVGCSTTYAPASCPSGGCAFYSNAYCGDDDEVGCTTPIPSTDPLYGCGPLGDVQCSCSGTAAL